MEHVALLEGHLTLVRLLVVEVRLDVEGISSLYIHSQYEDNDNDNDNDNNVNHITNFSIFLLVHKLSVYCPDFVQSVRIPPSCTVQLDLSGPAGTVGTVQLPL